MADEKNPQGAPAPGQPHAKVVIFTYPKIIFMYWTFFAALACGIGMVVIGDRTEDPARARAVTTAGGDATATAGADGAGETVATTTRPTPRRFASTQNVLAMVFLGVFALNLLIMAIDFPRFTLVGIILLVAALSFFLLWLNVYLDLVPPFVNFLEKIYATANAWFYFLIATVMGSIYLIVFATRYLDYWEIRPNEILHHHGPLSDLERYPTFNLKFDKEIPDILEFLMLGAGRLVLHVQNERRAIVLDNVLWIENKEQELKNLMSRMEVRLATDQELAES